MTKTNTRQMFAFHQSSAFSPAMQLVLPEYILKKNKLHQQNAGHLKLKLLYASFQGQYVTSGVLQYHRLFLDLFIINHNLPNSVQCFIKFGLCATLPKTYLPEFYHAAKGTNFHFCIHVCHSRTLLATIFFILTSENSNIMSV